MHKLNQITMKTKLFFRIICILSALLINLNLLKPGFSQATVEYHNLSVDESIKGVISIMFPEGWSTYWKFPGPNGFIPNPVSYTHLRAPRDRTRSRMPSSA